MNQSEILHLEGVTKSFSRNVSPAVDAVSFTLQKGDLLSFLGPSGCGKTTLLRLIAGFEQPEVGTISIARYLVAGSGCWIPPEKRDVGMVFQDYALFPHLNVNENVAFGLRGTLKNSLGMKKRVGEVLALVGLEGLGNRYPHQISGGQQQRVALARALAPRPALVLLDEPLSNLDVQVRLRLRQELRDILKAAGTSAIFVTHDQEEALCISDVVAVMRAGRLEQFGTPEDIYQQPQSLFVAEFVTQANFLPARRIGQRWETEVGSFQLNREVIFGDINSDVGALMIRQEELLLQPDDNGAAIIRDRQFLGREQCYHLQTDGGRELIARSLTLDKLPVGMRVKVTVAPQDLRLFARSQT